MLLLPRNMDLPSDAGSSLLWIFLCSALVWGVCRTVYRLVTNPLSSIPGPQFSKCSSIVLTYKWWFGRRAPYVDSLHKKYGPIVRVAPNEVHINDLSATREIHKVGGRYLKSKWYETLVPPGIVNVFTVSDPNYHSALRRLLAGPMADNQVKVFEPLVTSRVRLAISRIGEELERRGAADVFKWWLFFATDVIGELSFGDSFRMLETGKKNQYILDLERVSSLQAVRTTFPSLLRFSRYVPLPMFRSAYESGKRIGLYAHQSVERYKKLLQVEPNYPKTLFTRFYNAGKEGLSDAEIRNGAVGYIVAGSDTTAITLTYLTWAVCRHPEVQEKLVAELQSLPEDFTDKHLRELPYLSNVINETLRLYSSVPSALPRVVPPEGATLAGYYLPPGTTVCTQAYSLHRDPTIFPDPERFNPERWDNPTKEMNYAFMPFGGGSRICLGLHLARMELRLAVAHFYRAYPTARISTKEGMSDEDMKPKMYFLMSPAGHRCLIEA